MSQAERQAKRVFGPVPSRRLGRSLGVDLVPFKTCTFDCIYCQLGPTTCKTSLIKEWVPTTEVIDDVRDVLPRTSPDYVTISGSGEPTLHSGLGEIIDAIKSLTDTPVALLTNGSIFWKPDVRAAASMVDLVIPSLDAGTEDGFRKVNRPHESLSLAQVVDGLNVFCREFTGEVWLEVFLVDGVNANEVEVPEMVRLVEGMNPDKVQLNTVSRPPCESFARPVPKDELSSYAERFGPNCEVIADFQGVHELAEFTARRDDVLVLLKHRPCTIEGIAAGLGIHVNEVVKYVEELLDRKEIVAAEQSGEVYYTPY